MADKQQILKGRKAVDAYRTAHTKLYEKGWHKGIPEDHTPLLNIMLGAFKGLGFNSIQEFFNANKEYCLSLSGYQDTSVFSQRLDLGLADSLVGEYEQAKIDILEEPKETYARLFVDNKCLMTSDKTEHASMAEALKKCPDNARVFVAGFGLGLILLYLLEAQRVNQIVICEAQPDLAKVVSQKALPILKQKYPTVEFQIIEGDAFELVNEGRKFDWVFFDTGETEREMELAQTIQPALTEQGIYTHWTSYELEWH